LHSMHRFASSMNFIRAISGYSFQAGTSRQRVDLVSCIWVTESYP
jgi:hypothetical protein